MADEWAEFRAKPSAASDDPWAEFRETKPSVAADVAKQAGAGLVVGAENIAAAPARIAELGGKAVEWLGNKLGFSGAFDPEAQKQQSDLKALIAENRGEGISDYLPKPQTTAGKYARTAAEFVPGAMAMPGNLAVNAGVGAISGLGSEGAGQVAQKVAPQLETPARVAGALLGGVAPGVAARAITPLPASAARREAVNTLRDEGVTSLTAGDVTGRKGLRYFENEMGGNRAATLAEQKSEQFTEAALRRAGIQGETRATPEVMDNAFNRIGQQFDDIAARNTAPINATTTAEFTRIQNEYNQLVPASQRAPIVNQVIGDIVARAGQNGGVLDGAGYQAFRSRLDRAARTSRNDPQLADALFGVRRTIDDAMSRGMTNPADRAALRTARREYRNIIVLEKAATAAGEQTAEGFISPSALRNATVGQNRRAYARGQGDFADLARAGEHVLKPLPNSGTASRLAARGVSNSVGAILGAGLGGVGGASLGMPGLGAVAGSVAGTAAPHLAARAILRQPLRGYLGNQWITGSPNPTLTHQLLFQVPQFLGDR